MLTAVMKHLPRTGIALVAAKTALLAAFAAPVAWAEATKQRAELAVPPTVVGVAEAVVEEALNAKDLLNAAARLNIRFRGNTELSGDYRVGPDQTITVPVLGRVSLAGLDSAALEKELSQRVTEISQREAFVTVEIASYRPVFITGDVNKSGSAEWQPNMTVLQAIAMAGGSAPDIDMTQRSGPPGRKDFSKFVQSQKRTLASLARHKAARDDAKELELPPQLIELVGVEETKKLIAEETRKLAAERQTLADKLKIIREAVTAEKEQISALRQQAAIVKKNLANRKTELDRARDLMRRGYLTNERVLDHESKFAELQEKSAGIDVGIAKSVGTLANLELSELSHVRDWKRGIVDEIAKLDHQASLYGIDIATTAQVDGAPAASMKAPRVDYKIVRRNTTIDATLDTVMRPGDVLLLRKN